MKYCAGETQEGSVPNDFPKKRKDCVRETGESPVSEDTKKIVEMLGSVFSSYGQAYFYYGTIWRDR